MQDKNNEDELEFPIIKVVVIGESGVGKSNIISRYMLDKFHVCCNATIGVQFISKAIKIDGHDFLYQIWDTAGQERYRALNRTFYRNALGAIVTFSQGDRQSFLNLSKWIQQLRENANEEIVLLLAGNKCDLKEQKVSVTEANQFAKKQGMAYLETSAALNININRAFDMLSNKIYQIHREKLGIARQAPASSVLEQIQSRSLKKKKQKKCCQ